MARLSSNPAETIKNILEDFCDYSLIECIEKPLVVSKAPKTKLKGPLHEVLIKSSSKSNIKK